VTCENKKNHFLKLKVFYSDVVFSSLFILISDLTMSNSSSTSSNWSFPIYIQICLLITICFLTSVYNLLILIHKTFRANRMNWLSLNVSLATAFFATIQLLFTIFQQSNQEMVSCNFTGFIIITSATEIMYAYSIESFHRLLAIRYFSKRILRSNHELIITVIICWIIGIVLTIPHGIRDDSQCILNENPLWIQIYTLITVIILPSSIVCGCNTSILLYIRQISRRIEVLNNNKSNTNVSRRRDAYVSKIMLLKFLLFVIGWLPIFFGQVFFSGDNRLSNGVLLSCQFLLYFSLLCNVILLIYSNKPVRQYIKEKCLVFIKY